MNRLASTLLALSALPLVTEATTRTVPADYGTIQLAINAANAGDTVLVSPGRYTENIRFRGKDIVLASRYIIDQDPQTVLNTVIDGSSPENADTASCVLIVSGETRASVLEGFTLTGGEGTLWTDEHGAGIFREGGGILITLSSPTIRDNVIVLNEAIKRTANSSAGGGGMRCGDAAPLIEGNAILLNKGMYGGGIVLNFCSGAIVRNNIICRNRVYQAVAGATTYGGGGIWTLEQKAGDNTPNLIENNTIVGNTSTSDLVGGTAGTGGAIRTANPPPVIHNCIIWGNLQALGGPIGGTATVTYSDVEGGFVGTGNINVAPQFADSGFVLSGASPCIDAGEGSPAYFDPEDSGSPGNALFPSRGAVHNDMGAYGGPARSAVLHFSRPGLLLPFGELDFGNVLNGGTRTVGLLIRNSGALSLRIDSARMQQNAGGDFSILTSLPLLVGPADAETLFVKWAPTQSAITRDTLRLFSNDSIGANFIPAVASSMPTPKLAFNISTADFGNLPVTLASHDTTLYVWNRGTGSDSVFIGINAHGVQPDSSLEVEPPACALAVGDSEAIHFTVHPSLVKQTFLDRFSPYVVVTSKYSIDTTQYSKMITFHLVAGTGVNVSDDIPRLFRLQQNYPNPFNPSTRISFTLARTGFASLRVYSLLGTMVRSLAESRLAAGSYSIEWDGRDLRGYPVASGIYLCRLEAGEESAVIRMLLVK